jgi:hypothetical protein
MCKRRRNLKQIIQIKYSILSPFLQLVAFIYTTIFLTETNILLFFFSDVLRRWTDSATTVLPIITELLKNDIRVWVYR